MNASTFSARSAPGFAALLSFGALVLALSVAACGSDDDSEFGTLAVTVSGLPIEGIADVTVTGPGAFSQTLEGSETIGGLEPGTYEVRAEGFVLANAAIDDFYEPVPAHTSVEVRAGARAAVDIEYRRAGDPPIGTSGQLRVVVSGLPAGTEAAVTVTGPAGYESALTGTGILELQPGNYSITAEEVEVRGEFYVPSVDPSPAEVEVDAMTNVNVFYALEILEPA